MGATIQFKVSDDEYAGISALPGLGSPNLKAKKVLIDKVNRTQDVHLNSLKVCVRTMCILQRFVSESLADDERFKALLNDAIKDAETVLFKLEASE